MKNIQNYLMACGLALLLFSAVSAQEAQKKGEWLVLPVVFVTPETSIGGGGAGMYLFRFANATPETRVSSLQFLASYTVKNQIILSLPFDINLKDNRHSLRGFTDWRKFPFRFYGIGGNTANEDMELYTSHSFRIKADYLYRINTFNYVGLNYRLDRYSNVSYDSPTQVLANGEVLGSRGGKASGLGGIYQFDRRNHLYTPTEGPFVSLLFTFYRKWLGSDYQFNRLELDARHYIKLQQEQILGLQFNAFMTQGAVPFESLALLGHNTINRGYYVGRFRDKTMAAIQADYRIPLFRGDTPRDELKLHQRFGLAFFGALGNVAPSPDRLSIHNVKYSYGMGIRFLVKRAENINLRLDLGFGQPGNSGIYFMVGEAF